MDLLDDGWTMEKIWGELISALQCQIAAKVQPEQIVDVQTGEITDQDDDLEEELFGKEEAGDAPVSTTEEKPTGVKTKPKRDPETIKTINELLKACNDDFKMQPKDVYKELGYKSASDISETPSECYARIAAVRG